jgi:hypothetical protein
MQGRAMSLMGSGMMTLQGLGMTASGAAAQWAPPYAVFGGGGIIGTVSIILVLRSARRVRANATAGAGEQA